MSAYNTILVQTDFTVNSLNLVIKVLESKPRSSKINLILGYGISLSDSITDLLFFSEGNLLNTLKTSQFEEVLNIIINKYGTMIHSVQYRLFKGYNRSAFINFTEAYNINEAFVDKNLELKLPQKRSFNINYFILKSSQIFS